MSQKNRQRIGRAIVIATLLGMTAALGYVVLWDVAIVLVMLVCCIVGAAAIEFIWRRAGL